MHRNMSAPLPPFAALRAFEAVGRLGGIRRAAQSLGVSHAIVSRHLSGLEHHVGTNLLDRRTGQLTEAGRDYHARIARAIAELASATRAVQDAHSGRLSICCSPGFALHWLTRRLGDFNAGGSGLAVVLQSRDVEPDFERDDIDGDVRFAAIATAGLSSPGVTTQELARPAFFPVAAPEWLAARSKGLVSAASLLDLPLIEERDASEWSRWFAAQGLEYGEGRRTALRYGQAHLTLAAARGGQGIALANRFVVADDLAEGRLVRVMIPGASFVPVILGAYVFRCARGRRNDPALTRFRRWLQRQLAADVAGEMAG